MEIHKRNLSLTNTLRSSRVRGILVKYIMKSSCVSGATPALSNVWCTLLARHAQEQELKKRQHHHVPISLEPSIIWRQPEVKSLVSLADYLKLISMAGRSVQRARRPRPQKPPDVAPEWATVRAAPAAAAAAAYASSTSLSISVLIVSLRFDPHAPHDPQLAMAMDGHALAILSPIPSPATRADSQRKFYTYVIPTKPIVGYA